MRSLRKQWHAATCLWLGLCVALPVQAQQTSIAPATRTVADAHNCYPYYEWWYDRIDRALSGGVPVAIEQDLAWFADPESGRSWSILAHGPPLSADAPVMEAYFFERVRPIVETALKSGDKRQWPLITLNLDLKSEEPAHLRAIWELLQKYHDWLTTAPRTLDGRVPQPLIVRPILVLTGSSDGQQEVFYEHVPLGGELLVFGSVHTHDTDPSASPERLEEEPATNYRRWWNNSWEVVEQGGPEHGGTWTAAEDRRLRALVTHAHANHLWIRFYTLDGAATPELSASGWFRAYNFGSLQAAQERWRAAYRAGADYIASDQYEQLSSFLKEQK